MRNSHTTQTTINGFGLVLSSVELLPNAAAAAAFTVDSAKVFREDGDIIPITLSENLQYMP